MGYLAFFLLLTITSLLWAAACVAAAARVERPLWRGVLVVAGVVLPLLTLLPWLAASGYLAFGPRLRPNWFGPTLTVALSALVGGICIARGGLSSLPFSSVAVATRWPVIGLFALALIAKATAFGTLLILDNAVAAEARAMRVEAAAMMQAALPPAPADADNAARLHAQAAAAIAVAPELTAADGPINDRTTDVTSTAVGDLLARHSALLDTIRRAADLPGCRFPRDWTRPSLDMLLPEVQAARTEARFLALAARREAAEGKHAEAIADAVRIGRIGRQIGSEPLLISHLVGLAIDAMALDVLADILPRLGPGDAPLLDDPGLRDLVGSPPSLARAINGEEAFGLSTFADFADGRSGLNDLDRLSSDPNVATAPGGDAGRVVTEPLSAVWRVFFLPSDIAAYRRRFQRYRQLTSASADQSTTWPEMKRALDGVEDELGRAGTDGALSRLIAPATGSLLRAQSTAAARHRAAEVLLAATRQRLAGGSPPESIDALVPARLPAVPRDPFTKGDPLRMRVDGDETVVWSIGPDGEDDGGPLRDGEARDLDNDDVGLRMRVAAPAGAAP
jgi:hypothetical protein